MSGPVRPRAADVLLADGRIASIRPAVRWDREELTALWATVSAGTTATRLLVPSGLDPEGYLADLVAPPDGHTAVALVAVVGGRIAGLIGVRRTGAESGEVAVVVADDERRHGLGCLLVEHVAAACRDLGIHLLTADVPVDDGPMMRVFRDVGFDFTRHRGDGTVTVRMSTAATARAVEAADAREAASEARSLRPLLEPRSVVVTGVGDAAGDVGRAVLRSVLDGGFTGRLHVLHPTASRVEGVPAYAVLADVPGPVDLVVVAVPAYEVLAVVEDAAAARVPAVVVLTSGLEEVNAEGARLQDRLLRLARTHGMRLVGPSSMGLLANHPDLRLNATFAGAPPPAGGLAIAAQSGGAGLALLDTVRRHRVGVGSFVSLGERADVSAGDLLCAWGEDATVTAVALYLESLGNARKLARVARGIATRTPILAVTRGRATTLRRGRAAADAETLPPAAVEALLAQAGVVACPDAEALARMALLLQSQPLPEGRRLGVVTNIGGLGALAADAAQAAGLSLPDPSPSLRGQVDGLARGTTYAGGVIDVGVGVKPEQLGGVLGVLVASGEVDAVLVAIVSTTVAPVAPLVGAVAGVRPAGSGVPLVLACLGDDPGTDTDTDTDTGVADVAAFHSVEHAVEALSQAVRYAEWRRSPPSAPPARDVARAESVRTVAERLTSARDGERWLTHAEAVDLLLPYGLCPSGEVVTGAEEAVAVAGGLGYPVALKPADPDVRHKAERGLVHLRLAYGSQLRAAAGEVADRLGDAAAPLLVQPMLDGVEVALGVLREPDIGPLVVVAAGGALAGVLDDRAFLLPPVSAQDATRAIRSLRAWPLLDGHRGLPRCDVASLERMLVSLGQLALDLPQLAELDLDPVICGPRLATPVDAKIRLNHRSGFEDGVPRRLRTSP